MEPEYAGSEGAKTEGRLKPMSFEEKLAALLEEAKVLRQLPRDSTYPGHVLRFLDKILHLLSVQRTTSQDEELQLLFSGLNL